MRPVGDSDFQTSGETIMETSLYQAKTLARSNDPETSKAAAVKMVKSGMLNRQEQQVWEAILCLAVHAPYPECTDISFTAKEVSAVSSVDYYTIQRRLSSLHYKGKIELTGARRDGCRVWRLI